MSYKSILVNLDLDGPVRPLLELAVDFAARSDARLIGFSAADAQLPIAGPEGVAIAAEVWEQEKEAIEQRLKELRSEFEKVAAGKVAAEWRGQVGNPTRSLANTGRLADIIITAARDARGLGEAYRIVDPGSLVLQAGKPVLVAAKGASHLAARKIVVAWKDTRESRRAVTDAVPLLRFAEDVVVVTVDREPDDSVRASVADVATYLTQHGIKARGQVVSAKNESDGLASFIRSQKADLVVSGAYGHSRFREWAFGGVTRSLLDEVGLNRLMAS